MGLEIREFSELPRYIARGYTGQEMPAVGLPSWSGRAAPPAIHDRVRVVVVGEATVVGYFTQGQWLGVVCKPHDDARPVCFAFGAELVEG